MAIKEVKLEDGTCCYLLSAYGVWRPGSFDSKRTARIAQRRDDSEILNFQRVANFRMPGGVGGTISESLIRELTAPIIAANPQRSQRRRLAAKVAVNKRKKSRVSNGN